MKVRKKNKIIILSIIIVFILLYAIPIVRKNINEATSILTRMDLDKVVSYIRSYGAWAAIISFLLMIFQAVIPFIPAFLITFANAAIFGWWQGAILSWSSAMVGAIVCFYIARILGRDFAEKFTSKTALSAVDSFFKKYGKHTILICRLLPFISFDLISYAAGLTSITFASFIIATGIGQLPATIVYSYVGGMLTGGAKKLMIALLIFFAITVLVFLVKKAYQDKNKDIDVNLK